jgi:excinuclease UvrABC nuclease subunit
MSVSDLIAERNEAKAHTHQFMLWRRMWEEYANGYELEWNTHRLEANQAGQIPEEAGVYSLILQPGIANHPACVYLMYVGRTNSLRRRFGEYLNQERRITGRPKIFSLLNMYPNHTWFCCAILPENEIEAAEEALIAAFIPPKNDQLPARVSRVIAAL